MKKHQSARRRRTQRDIDELLRRYHRSGMTVYAFCASEGVASSSVYNWLKRERREPAAPAMVEVSPPSPLGERYVVCTPSGYRIECSGAFSAGALKRLLDVVEA